MKYASIEKIGEKYCVVIYVDGYDPTSGDDPLMRERVVECLDYQDALFTMGVHFEIQMSELGKFARSFADDAGASTPSPLCVYHSNRVRKRMLLLREHVSHENNETLKHLIREGREDNMAH